MRLWPRKQRPEPEPEPPPPPPPEGPKTGDDLRKAFLDKLESRSDDQPE